MACPSCGSTLTVRGSLGHFELEQVAGRGGMGVVYKALDASLDRHVALKLLRKDHSNNAKLIAQLETEAAITASINHPHVVKVFSTGTERGRFYLAMELVNRGSLDDLIRIQGRVAEAQVLDVGIQIAQGLRAAQQHGLIHRDVKPGNILFSEPHTAKIVDFGLAIFMEDEEAVRGEIWGTPYYVAPEKLDNKPEDFRSDIYSLGGTLFHALAGRPPFEAESASMVALKHLKSQPMSLQAYAPHVSGSTAYVINRTLHKDPDQRYQSYDELIEHLEYARTELLENGGRTQQKRVVLEGTDDQKAWGWVTAGMIVFMVGLGAVGWSMRDKTAKPEAPKAAPSTVASSQAIDSSVFLAARGMLAEGKSAEAAAIFNRLSQDPKLAPSDATWAVFQGGLAELSGGRAQPARTLFGEVAGRAAAIQGNPELVTFFTETAERLKQGSPIPVAAGKDLKRDNYQSIALLAFGLHNWHLGKHEDGVALLRQFRSASPTGADAWITKLRPLAANLIEELTQFQMNSAALTNTASPEDRAAAATALRELKGALAPRAAAVLEQNPVSVPAAGAQETSSGVPVTGPSAEIADGVYQVINRLTGKALAVADAATKPGANVHQQEYRGTPNQHWQLKRAGEFIEVTAMHSQGALDVEMSSNVDGGNIHQWTKNGTPAQKWILQAADGGFFKIVNAGSGKLVAVLGASAEEGADVIQWSDTGAQDQQWKLVPAGK
ncbi:MAG TPA: protein kinase [Chthoniobacteraceae bacterium]